MSEVKTGFAMPIPPSLGGRPRRSRSKSFSAGLSQIEGMRVVLMDPSNGIMTMTMK